MVFTAQCYAQRGLLVVVVDYSVRPSHLCIISKRLNIKLFSLIGSSIIIVFFEPFGVTKFRIKIRVKVRVRFRVANCCIRRQNADQSRD